MARKTNGTKHTGGMGAICLMVLLVLTACGTSPYTKALPVSLTPLATQTPAPTQTPGATSTETATATDTLTPTPALIAGIEVPLSINEVSITLTDLEFMKQITMGSNTYGLNPPFTSIIVVNGKGTGNLGVLENWKIYMFWDRPDGTNNAVLKQFFRYNKTKQTFGLVFGSDADAINIELLFEDGTVVPLDSLPQKK